MSLRAAGELQSGPLERVEGRRCGACNECCQHLLITDPSLSKLPGILCAHCDPGNGCTIHASRPDACRAWFCAWHYFAEMGTPWRPDRSGLLIEFETHDIPEGFSRRLGLKVTVLKSPVRLSEKKTVSWLCGCVLQSVPVFLATRPAPGCTSGKALLNNRLAEPAKARDLMAARAAIRACYDEAARVPVRAL